MTKEEAFDKIRNMGRECTACKFYDSGKKTCKNSRSIYNGTVVADKQKGTCDLWRLKF